MRAKVVVLSVVMALGLFASPAWGQLAELLPLGDPRTRPTPPPEVHAVAQPESEPEATQVVVTIPPPVIPIFVTTTVAASEPLTLIAVGLGLLGAGWLRRRDRRALAASGRRRS
jgi:hypothetical protein